MNNKKILIIEDDLKVLDEIYEALNKVKSYNIRKSSHGEEGLSVISIFRPDLVILDIMLPEIDGFEICKRIKEMPESNRPKIILLTILTNLLNKMESNWLHQTGASALLTKPVDFNKLMAAIDDIF